MSKVGLWIFVLHLLWFIICQSYEQSNGCMARHCMCSASSSSLIVWHMHLPTIDERSFLVTAACICNSLPQHVMSAPSLSVFHSRLKLSLQVLLPLTAPISDTTVVPKKWHHQYWTHYQHSRQLPLFRLWMKTRLHLVHTLDCITMSVQHHVMTALLLLGY